MTLRDIVVRGASEHNLRQVDVTIPRLALTTITGVSGSGKSSLAFDTIYREGQRRYVESLSAYARQFLGRMEKPKVERIDGLSPTVLIDQKTVNRNPRSTVGTITEIHDHLRLLFARLGTPRCPTCGVPLSARTVDDVVERLVADHAGRRVVLLAPVVRDRKGEYRRDLEGWRLKGFTRAWIDGAERRLDERVALRRNVRHTIELVVDRLRVEEGKRGRLAEAVARACELADGLVGLRVDGGEARVLSTRNTCPEGHGEFAELEPRLFSFNSPHGACATCDGLGVSRQPDETRIVADPGLSIREGALRPYNVKTGFMSFVRLGPRSLERLAREFDVDLDRPWRRLPRRARDLVLYGSGDREITLTWEWRDPKSARIVRGRDTRPYVGLVPAIERILEMGALRQVERYLSVSPCPDCDGTRLGEHARHVFFRGRRITDLDELTVDELAAWFATLELDGRETLIARQLVREIGSRLRFLRDVGLGYLRLDRAAPTLSGGESQRVRLATQLGSGLQGVLYVLDEPSIGLHARDNGRLIRTLLALRDKGNTALVVEHDEETMRRSDVLVDMGPGAGVQGGEVLAAGPIEEVLAGPPTPTTRFLLGEERIEVPRARRTGAGAALTVVGARQHNLQDLTVRFPLGRLVAVTGVSGSGKSTLVDHVLERALARTLHGAEARPGEHDAIEGLEHVDKVIEIDQLPIGRTPRSNPATYSGAMDDIRDLFAGTADARVRGYAKGRFSFNVRGGRCEECQGAGVKTIEMQLLPDVEVACEGCGGRRYNAETREIRYRGLTIDEVLDMTVEEAHEAFANHRRLVRTLRTLLDVGLGYLPLGQPSTTLSGGEAQRMKLASELARPATGRTLYILDEPTTGLHFADIRTLIGALQALVDAGNTMIVVEHNLDVVKVADWVVDLGPEGGGGGGRLVAEGTPEEVSRVAGSHTGRALRGVLGSRRRRAPPRARPRARERTGADLVVKGAALHNLRDVNVTIPHGRMTVVTGPSGSGKTSLAFDTVFAEGQRRFVESLSTYARRFLSRLDRPPVDAMHGLAPAIAIDQKTAGRNPRSTVGTTTEIHDYLRLLFARVGMPHCPGCGKALKAWAPTDAAGDLLRRAKGERIVVTAPLFSADHEHPTLLLEPGELGAYVTELQADGFVRLLVDGEERRLPDVGRVGGARAIELVVDRLRVDGRRRARLAEAVAQAQQRGRGLAHARREDGGVLDYEARAGCARCGTRLPEGGPTPRMFSFNSHVGACRRCDGLGRLMQASEARLVDRPDRPLLAGALGTRVGKHLTRRNSWTVNVLRQLAEREDVDLGRPWSTLPAGFRSLVLHGDRGDDVLDVRMERRAPGRSRRYELQVQWKGLLAQVGEWWRNTERDGWWRRALEAVMETGTCPACRGGRLRPEALATRVGGLGPRELLAMTVARARATLSGLRLSGADAVIAEDVLAEVVDRLAFLENVGLGYLTLDRPASTLSGGEAQRIRLASQLGNRLVGVLYVLDEPSIGLHPRDQRKLLDTLAELRDLGNTIVVVEHDRETIEAADHVIDLGPGAGHHGGRVVAAGPPERLARSRRSLTGRYLSGRRAIPVPAERRRPRQQLVLRGARLHNLRDVDARVPVGALTVVTGVSGSGKSSLVMGLLVPAVRARLQPSAHSPRELEALEGGHLVQALRLIDQAPIGSSPHSNPATYSGAFDEIRALFARTPEARMRGFTPGSFSYNVPGGRCEACQGRGVEVIEMHFLSDVTVPCDACGGRRYGREVLEVRWRGRSIADVLEMEIAEALDFFEQHARIRRRLGFLDAVGLGYMKMGQSSTTLSGGEAQRVKLAAELARPETGRALIVLDEPTTGLHFEDVGRLVEVLDRLVERGNTIVVIEHNVDVVKQADHVIDLGPEGGAAGGRVVVQGTPEAVAARKGSHTGRVLREALGEVVG